MKKEELEQIKNIIKNFEDQKSYIPFIWELEKHPIFGPLFKPLDKSQRDQIQKIINDYILEKINNSKTKWWELFKRFFDVNTDMFWEFRRLNEDFYNNEKKFQEVWRKVEKELFKYEWILTAPMLKQEKWLEKVVTAFYNIVYMFFPLFNNIE